MSKKFNTQHNIITHSKPEDYSGQESRVDMIGYIPRDRLIQMFINSGKRLVNERGVFDFHEDVDIDEYEPDPTRSKAFDLADASEAMKGKKIVRVLAETGEYIDEKGRVRNIKDGGVILPKSRPDTPSRSVSGQMTPELESGGDPPDPEKGKKLDKTNKKE